jgi:hypothetical protein
MAEALSMAELETDQEQEESAMTPRITGRPRGRIPKSRIARPHSHLYRSSGRKAKGGKHSRRWENSQFIMRYLDEDDELSVDDIVPEHCSALASLFREPGKMKMWREFANSTDKQFIFLNDRKGLVMNGTNETVDDIIDGKMKTLSTKLLPLIEYVMYIVCIALYFGYSKHTLSAVPRILVIWQEMM